MTASSNRPGPGRSTVEAAFEEVRKDIARRNEQAHKLAREARAAREQRKLALRRERDQQ